jgi:hypothetical protein
MQTPQQPSTFTVPAQRAGWAMRTLQQAGIRAQAQRTGKDYAFAVPPKDAERAAQALEPITNYQSGGGWRTTIRHIEDWIIVLALPVAGVALLVSGGAAVWPVTAFFVAGGVVMWLWNSAHDALHSQHEANQAAGVSGVGCVGNLWTWATIAIALLFAGVCVAYAFGVRP